MYIQSIFVMFLVASAGALVTPRVSVDLHRRHQHAALAKARAAAPGPVPDPLLVSPATVQLKKRCKPRNSTSTSGSAPKASQASHPGNIANVAESPAQSHPSPAPAPPSKPPAPATPPPPPPPPPAPAPPSGGGGVLSGAKTGDGTFYATGLGACGIVNRDTDFIAAASRLLFDTFPGAGADPNQNPICGRKVRANFQGKSVVVTVTDRCEACKFNDLDFSPSAFNTLADPSLGRIFPMTWSFL